ncbi:hypothetical protein NA57DRAFT_39822 [Rhizodiscina lignyota]|uniref:6-methylsalicylate decarboxylase n=1 Tax=Rhizodiscina lignyota TaxID=1504668 RepID=A0A9P4M6T0_9PEZI|nr:hypothetical protein NA57DRAFT_39822 [Rhizodiscina lignyota]
MATQPMRIDTHVHYLPDFYREELARTGHTNLDGMPAIPEWSEGTHLKMMADLNISRSILSISSPGTHLTPGDNPSARSLTRRINAFGADLKRRDPKHFGYFASLPLPDVDGALKEIEIACREGADGFCLMSNCHGVYLGDAAFDPVFAAMNRHHAKIFIHPTAGCLCNPHPYPPQRAPPTQGSTINNQEPGKVLLATPLDMFYPAPMMEFLFDTARTVIHLFLQGTIVKYTDLTWLIPHVGGAMPPLIYRFAVYGSLIPLPSVSGSGKVTHEIVQEAFRNRFYFDLAGMSMRGQVEGLVANAGIGKDRLLYGSDYPFTKREFVEMVTKEMDEMTAKWEPEDREVSMYKNAVSLFGDGKA